MISIHLDIRLISVLLVLLDESLDKPDHARLKCQRCEINKGAIVDNELARLFAPTHLVMLQLLLYKRAVCRLFTGNLFVSGFTKVDHDEEKPEGLMLEILSVSIRRSCRGT